MYSLLYVWKTFSSYESLCKYNIMTKMNAKIPVIKIKSRKF